MKKRKSIFTYLFCIVLLLMGSLTACDSSSSGNQSTTSDKGSVVSADNSSGTGSADIEQTVSSTDKKILVAYFSQSGHTQNIAKQIHDQVGGDLFEITLEHPYPSDYNTFVNQAKKEIDEKDTPPLKTTVKDMKSYDVIFVGTPIWYLKMSSPLRSFLSDYDFSGKTIIPFYTYGGAGGSVVSDIKKLCPKANVKEDTLAVRDSDTGNVQNVVANWLKKNDFIK